MIEKLSIEEFRQIKKILSRILEELNSLYDKGYKNIDKSKEDEYIKEYIAIQERLLRYDLSDIPFEEWEGLIIASDDTHRVDFSKSKANIDFELVEYEGNANFKGCKVRNLKAVEHFLNENDFDEETIKQNQELFLPDTFNKEFRNKYYNKTLTIEDFAKLSDSELDFLDNESIKLHIDSSHSTWDYNRNMIDNIGLIKCVKLYNYSKEDYKTVSEMLNIAYTYGATFRIDASSKEALGLLTYEQFLNKLKEVDVSDIKKTYFDFCKSYIVNTRHTFNPDTFPKSFIDDNPDLFLTFENIPDEVKERYFNRALTVIDLIDYPDAFKKVDIENFMTYMPDISDYIKEKYGKGKFFELVQKYPDIFKHIAMEYAGLRNLKNCFKENLDLETNFIRAVKTYFAANENLSDHGVLNVPDWLSSINFHFVRGIDTIEELLNYTENVFIIDSGQRRAIDTLGIENIKKLEEEYGFFTHKGSKWSKSLEMLRAFSSYFHNYKPQDLIADGIDFKDGTLPYNEFLIEFAKCLDHMKKHFVFSDFPDYDWLEGKFRDEHPEIFIDKNAPAELKTAFYRNSITPEFLYYHKECIPYLINKNLSNTIRADIKLLEVAMTGDNNTFLPDKLNFINEYAKRYGNESLLKLISKYGEFLSSITITSLHDEIESEEEIEKSLRNAIYAKILNSKANYAYLADVEDFTKEYPDIFINLDNLTNLPLSERENITKSFYNRSLSFDTIRKYPFLVKYLKDKNLYVAFGRKNGNLVGERIVTSRDDYYSDNYRREYSDLELLKVFGNEKFLELCSKYGRYMNGISNALSENLEIIKNNYVFKTNNNNINNYIVQKLSFKEIVSVIEYEIAKKCTLGNINYSPSDAPEFLKETHPELFLSEDAPYELQACFYKYNDNVMSFEKLKEHKDWLSFLKGKSLKTALLKNNYFDRLSMLEYFEKFGEEKAIKLGISKAETVEKMIKNYKVDLMKAWYDKTGGKFIPDYIVMQNFPLEEADKFLTSASNWSNLMRIKSFAKDPDARDAMLKLAYSFGAFDNDQRGFKKLIELLTGLPKKLGSDKEHVLSRIDSIIDTYSQRGLFYKNESIIKLDGSIKYEYPPLPDEEKEEAYSKMLNYAKQSNFVDLIDTDVLVELLETLKKEKVSIDFSKRVFSQLYRKNDDGTYTLTINEQSYPKTAEIVRDILSRFNEISLISPSKAHHYLGGFNLTYDPDFREFFLSNLGTILNSHRYLNKVSQIQKRFDEIKKVYKNVPLTLDMACSYIEENRYENINPGNERVTSAAAINEYDQRDFETLQLIYNIAKQRTFSSIPRIEGETEKYTYEILRLDDPLAMAIGKLTDCCQRLGEPGRQCMEHSMVDKNGRLFVVRSKEGEIIAQSWVWRNKDVLCFDNIEVPDRQMWDHGIPRGMEDNAIRNEFTDEILEVYKKAAHELIEKDEKVYKELLEKGIITKEQYEGLRLGKITTGLGYSNITGSLETLEKDKEMARPIPWKMPIDIGGTFYTSDSASTQFILDKRDGRKEYNGETIQVHNDTYLEYTDDTFDEKGLLTLNKLELLTKNNSRYLDTSVREGSDKKHIVTNLAHNYNLNPETTRVVMNPNFAIIYDVNGNKVKIADLLFNTKIDNGSQQIDIENVTAMQIRLALEQITSGREVDISELEDNQIEMYNKAMNLKEEFDIERGTNHARQY